MPYQRVAAISSDHQVSIVGDGTPLPPQIQSQEADDDLFAEDAWVEPSIHIDYGTNVKLGKNVFINFNCTIVDTCLVTIGDRTLFAPNISLYSGTHPLDPEVRNGTQGPELGGEIHIEEDCWLGGNVTVLPGVRIGKGSVVGAGSVVTKVGLLMRTCIGCTLTKRRMCLRIPLLRAIQHGSCEMFREAQMLQQRAALSQLWRGTRGSHNQ